MSVTNEEEGSWSPTIVLLCFLVFRWITRGDGDIPVKLRRWYGLKVRETAENNNDTT